MINEEAIKVVPIQGIKWADVRPAMENPLESFVAHKLPVYVRVNSPHEVVLCTRKVKIGGGISAAPPAVAAPVDVPVHRHVDGGRLALPAGARSLLEEDAPALTKLWESDRDDDRVLETIGFDSAIQFLRVPEDDLRRMALYREVTISFFNAGGLEEVSPAEEIPAPLRRSAITRAGLVRQVMVGITGRYERPRNAEALYDVAEQRTIRANDLYVIESEFQAMLEMHAAGSMSASFPFDWGFQAPGVVWLYEAAYLHNHLKVLEAKEIGNWLRKNARVKPDRICRWSDLERWVLPSLDRRKGRDKRPVKQFSLDVIQRGSDEFTKFKPEFVGDGLALVLYFFDKWFDLLRVDHAASPVTLGRWLVHEGFDDKEAVFLIQLATGQAADSLLRDAVAFEYDEAKSR